MLKKRGKIITAIIIILLIIPFSLICQIIGLLPDPEIGYINDWEIDHQNSTYTETYLSANITLSNPHPYSIDLLNYIKGEILYNKTKIGELSFSPFDDNNVDSKTLSNSDTTEKGKLIEIKGKEEKVIPIYSRFFNCEIPRIWEHQLKNKTGELSVKLILTFRVLNNIISLEYSGFGSKFIETNILEKLNTFIKELPLNETKIIGFKRINLSLVKHKGNEKILLNLNVFGWTSTLWKFQFQDEFKIKEIDKITTFTRRIKLNKRTIFPFLFKKFPLSYVVYANDIKIMEIQFIESDQNTGRIFFNKFWKEKEFDFEISLYNTLLDDCLSSHIMNNETTKLEIFPTQNGQISTKFSFPYDLKTDIAKSIPKIDLELNKETLDEIFRFLIRLQFLIGILITALTVFLIMDFLCEKKLKRN